MSVHTAAAQASARGLLARSWEANKPLTGVGVAMIVTLLLAAVGLVVDPRVITGAPAWLKPAKFAISITLYSFTFLWLLTFVKGHPRVVRLVSWITAIAFVVEMVLIVGAAALGTTSHFNVSTPLHAAVWSTMGTAIVAAWVAGLIVGVLLLRQRLADQAFAWSLRLGVLISAVGMGLAFFMTSPTAQQLQGARSGQGMDIVGAHAVGVADGGAGLSVVGWSTEGGDLRVGHFFGLHALQLLPFIGFALTRWAPAWLRARDRVALVWTAGIAYLAFVLLVTAQALRAQPLLSPDALTLAGLGVIVGGAALATAIIVRKAKTA